MLNGSLKRLHLGIIFVVHLDVQFVCMIMGPEMAGGGSITTSSPLLGVYMGPLY